MASCQACGKQLGCGCQLKTNSKGQMVCDDCLKLDTGVSITGNTTGQKTIVSPNNQVSPFKVIISKVTGTITRNN